MDLIGNDVVDLTDPDTAPGAIHPRFDQRVFTTAEREQVASAADPVGLRWTLWAAKESAFKAWSREDPDLAFRPIRYAVDLISGSVRHAGRQLYLSVDRTVGRVHVVAASERVPSGLLVGVEPRNGDDPSGAVRALAGRLVGSGARIVTEGRIPWAVVAGQRYPVSLSHHGGLVAVAALLG